MQAEIETIVASTSDHPAQTGLVVGMLSGDQRSIHGYGTVGGAPPTGETLFEIGSVTKVFTTGLLSILTTEGVVTLDDTVSKLAPELAGFPPQITLQRLATHTAGLPKMPTNILGSMLRDRGNPYAAYASEDLMQYLIKRPPSARRIEADQVDYSNLGMALLGMLLARRLGVSYEAAITGKICEPLEMKDTRIQLTPDQMHKIAAPHNARGRPSRNWDMPAFEGAGALKSTANDLLSFMAAHLGGTASSLTKPLEDCHRVRFRTFAPPGSLQRMVARISGQVLDSDRTQEGMALGWTIGRLSSSEDPIHWHHGATGAYRAFVGFALTQRVATVVLTNSGLRMRDGFLGTTATDRVGFAVLDHLATST